MDRHWRALGVLALLLVVVLAGCAPLRASATPESDFQVSADDGTAPIPTTTPPTTAESAARVSPTAATATPPPALPPATTEATEGNPCGVAPIVVPTPAPDPGYNRLDPSTGLHVTGKMQLVDLDTYRLRVTGKVERPLELTYDQIRCLPKVEASPDLECPGFFVDRGVTWVGVPIADVLDLAGVQGGAREIEFVSADGYKTSLELGKALDRANFLAYEWEGEPLPRLHGFPLRAVLPGLHGSRWAKWVVEIVVR
jgi:DMSO/TMAO reductase YedYZ molybdopterin-dependent catalytic subunit